MLAGFNGHHDLVVGKHGRNRHNATRDGFTQNNDVGTNSLVVTTQKLACAGDSGLHFISDEQYVVLFTEVFTSFQVSVIGNENTGFTLNGFNEESGYLISFHFENLLESIHIVVGDDLNSRRVRAVFGTGFPIGGKGNDCNGTSVKISFASDNNGLIFGDSFFQVTPFSGELQSGFNGFCSRIHGQHLVVTEVTVDKLFVRAQAVVVKCARSKAQCFRLFGQCPHDLRVTMSLIHGRIGGKEVEVFFAINIPDIYTFPP